jgi:hypothetical protein
MIHRAYLLASHGDAVAAAADLEAVVMPAPQEEAPPGPPRAFSFGTSSCLTVPRVWSGFGSEPEAEHESEPTLEPTPVQKSEQTLEQTPGVLTPRWVGDEWAGLRPESEPHGEPEGEPEPEAPPALEPLVFRQVEMLHACLALHAHHSGGGAGGAGADLSQTVETASAAARRFYDNGRWEEAAAAYRGLLELVPHYSTWHYEGAAALRRAGRLREALGELEAAVAAWGAPVPLHRSSWWGGGLTPPPDRRCGSGAVCVFEPQVETSDSEPPRYCPPPHRSGWIFTPHRTPLII